MVCMHAHFDEGHLYQALLHFNEAIARDVRGSGNPVTSVVRLLFRSLYWLKAGFRDAPAQGGVTRLADLVRFATATEQARSLFFGGALRNLAIKEPQIMDHDVLKKHGYQPEEPIDPQLQLEATSAHRGLVDALTRLDSDGTSGAMDQVVESVAELLFVVSCNIAPGDESSYRPDLTKRDRDRSASIYANPLCQLLVRLLLGMPNRRLVAWGDLAPGGRSHYLIENVVGRWLPCTIEGVSEKEYRRPNSDTRYSYTARYWLPGGTGKVETMMLESEALPLVFIMKNACDGYALRLVPVQIHAEDGTCNLVVANALLS